MRNACVVMFVTAIGLRTSAAETAAELFQQGLKLIDEGKPAEACAKLVAAMKLEPDKPGVLLNLGVCNAQQNKVASALAWFRRALTLAAQRGMVESENVAKQQLVALGAKVPTIKIAFTRQLPEGATVAIDGVSIAATAFARLELDAGTHTAEIRGPGLESTSQTFEVKDVPDARQLVTLDLRAAVPATRYIEVDRGARRRRYAWIVGGVGAGLIVAETGLGLLARNQFDGSDDLQTRQRWKGIARYGTTSMFVVGAAALAAGVGLYLTAPGKERVERTAIVPLVDDKGLGVAVGGRF